MATDKDPNDYRDTDVYYMNIAIAVRRKADCCGRKIGAVLVRSNRIISTGYNGTPEGVTNCTEGGCVRCKHRERYGKSAGYDVCICVHAEQNALLSAARFGISVEGATAYSTMRPCFDCTKAMLQAKIYAVYYLHEWSHPIPSLAEQYDKIQERFEGRVQRVNMIDLEADWANGATTRPSRKRRRIGTVAAR
jgi:dCMP deaminase